MLAENARALQGLCVLILLVIFVIVIRSWNTWPDDKKLTWYPPMSLIQGFCLATILLPWEPS